MTQTQAKPKRKPQNLGHSARITLTALSLLGFVGGWNLIGRAEQQQAQASEPVATPLPPLPPTATPPPTPWPAIPPLEIPTMVPTLTTTGLFDPALLPEITLDQAGLPPLDLAPLPGLAPLPTLAPLPDLPAPPPPPPPPPPSRSGGS
ncbi:MAG TPA: hypothetical protein PKE64_10920 [Anaerolineae bacterium]|nr:hypothetical protein [Anaerolineae bacterium]